MRFSISSTATGARDLTIAAPTGVFVGEVGDGALIVTAHLSVDGACVRFVLVVISSIANRRKTIE